MCVRVYSKFQFSSLVHGNFNSNKLKGSKHLNKTRPFIGILDWVLPSFSSTLLCWTFACPRSVTCVLLFTCFIVCFYRRIKRWWCYSRARANFLNLKTVNAVSCSCSSKGGPRWGQCTLFANILAHPAIVLFMVTLTYGRDTFMLIWMFENWRGDSPTRLFFITTLCVNNNVNWVYYV